MLWTSIHHRLPLGLVEAGIEVLPLLRLIGDLLHHPIHGRKGLGPLHLVMVTLPMVHVLNPWNLAPLSANGEMVSAGVGLLLMTGRGVGTAIARGIEKESERGKEDLLHRHRESTKGMVDMSNVILFLHLLGKQKKKENVGFLMVHLILLLFLPLRLQDRLKPAH